MSHAIEVGRWIEHPDENWNSIIPKLADRLGRHLSVREIINFLAEHSLTATWRVHCPGEDRERDPVLSLEIVFESDSEAVFFKLWFEPTNKRLWPKVHTGNPNFKYHEVVITDYK